MMFENFSADIVRARKDNKLARDWFSQNVRVFLKPTTLIVAAYRFGHSARQVRLPVVRQLAIVIAAIVRRLLEWLTGCFIAPSAEIGPGFVIHNLYGILIGETKIGKNFTIYSGAKIGDGVKSMGDDVTVCLNAMVLENVTIGNNVRVAPGSVVITDVADDTTIMGVPARIRLRRTPLRRAAGAGGYTRIELNTLDAGSLGPLRLSKEDCYPDLKLTRASVLTF